MIEKNIRLFRLQKRLSIKRLSELADIPYRTLCEVEKGAKQPDMEMLERLAEVLQVGVIDFLNVRIPELVFQHGDFRKNARLSKMDQDYISEVVEEYASRFYTVPLILERDVLPEIPECRCITATGDCEVDAVALRRHLGFAPNGPVSRLYETLEQNGFLLVELEIDNPDFSGRSGFVNERPYIAFNAGMHEERRRSTIVHELYHLMFEGSSSIEENVEKNATAVSGAFLLSSSDLRSEFIDFKYKGSHNMEEICKKYGVSMYLLVKRAALIGAITKDDERSFYKYANAHHWHYNEPERIIKEHPKLLFELVLTAFKEEAINLKKAAELLHISYIKFQDILSDCSNGGNECR